MCTVYRRCISPSFFFLHIIHMAGVDSTSNIVPTIATTSQTLYGNSGSSWDHHMFYTLDAPSPAMRGSCTYVYTCVPLVIDGLSHACSLSCLPEILIGERERANLVVSTADFSLYIYIYIFRVLDATIP